MINKALRYAIELIALTLFTFVAAVILAVNEFLILIGVDMGLDDD